MIGDVILLDPPCMDRMESLEEEEEGSSLGGALLRLGGSLVGGGALDSEGGRSPGGCGCPEGMPADTDKGGGGRLDRDTVAMRGLGLGSSLPSLEGGAEGGGPRGMGTTLGSARSEGDGVPGVIGLTGFGLSSSVCSNMEMPPDLTGAAKTAGTEDFGWESLMSLSGLLTDWSTGGRC